MIDRKLIKKNSEFYTVKTVSASNCCLDYSVHPIRIIDIEEANDITHIDSLKIVFVTTDDNIEHYVFLTKNTGHVMDDSQFEGIFMTEGEAYAYVLERINHQIDSITTGRDVIEKRLAHYLWQLRKIVPKCFKIRKKEDISYDREN